MRASSSAASVDRRRRRGAPAGALRRCAAACLDFGRGALAPLTVRSTGRFGFGAASRFDVAPCGAAGRVLDPAAGRIALGAALAAATRLLVALGSPAARRSRRVVVATAASRVATRFRRARSAAGGRPRPGRRHPDAAPASPQPAAGPDPADHHPDAAPASRAAGGRPRPGRSSSRRGRPYALRRPPDFLGAPPLGRAVRRGAPRPGWARRDAPERGRSSSLSSRRRRGGRSATGLPVGARREWMRHATWLPARQRPPRGGRCLRKNPAATYSPRRMTSKYHRRGRA